ncbi:hypothetical protein EBU24_04090 [bacterium]|nr:hypothetical protein [bacterium]
MKELRHLALFIGICALPGCDGGVSDWVNQTFEQGKTHQFDKKLVKKYLKSVRVYDEFNTVALFDVLWLSNDIRTTYALLHGDMNGLSREAANAFLRRQLKANDHFLTFYVLSAHDIPLNMTPSLWNMYLKIGEKTYSPLEVKVVEFNPEYRAIFGSVLTNHKRPYEVKFDRKDPDGNEIVPSSVKTISFNLSSPLYYAAVEFPVEEQAAPIMQQEEVAAPIVLNDEKGA